MGNKARCKFLNNNANDIHAFLESLGYEWKDCITAYGTMSNPRFFIKSDGNLVEIQYGDYIVYDFSSKQFSVFTKEQEDKREYKWTFIGKNYVKNKKSDSPDFDLQFCDKCIQMTNHLENKCQKCKIKHHA